MSLPQYSGGMVRTVTAHVDDASGASSENLLSYSLGGWYFVLRSIPCFATDLALGDVIHCTERDGHLHVEEVVVRGGGSTLRLLVDNEHPAQLLSEHPAASITGQPGMRERVAGQLITAGCSVERLGHHLLAVSVGPDVDLPMIEDFLDDLAGDGVLQVHPGYIHQ
ncbi:MAG: DUF4265 domain-containing protein [Corynebacterium sp.]|uniref:DUF4265 domain-containing protein n=1 Tax=Corynebacterium sp. TaxID=1720 RepID=UPI003F95F389